MTDYLNVDYQAQDQKGQQVVIYASSKAGFTTFTVELPTAEIAQTVFDH